MPTLTFLSPLSHAAAPPSVRAPPAPEEDGLGASLFVSDQEGAALRVCRDLVRLRTERPLQFVDLTELVEERVRRSGVREGMATVQSRHTTAAVLVNENEPLLLHDFEDALRRWAPADARYRPNALTTRAGAPPDQRPIGPAHPR